MIIKSRDDLDQALAQLGELEANKLAVIADMDKELADVRDSYADEFMVPLKSGPKHVDDVRAELMADITKYCDDHRDELLTGDTKSLKLTHGVIGWQNGPASIEVLALDEKAAKKSVLAKCVGLVNQLVAGLTRKLGKVPISNVLRVKVEWDKTAVMKAVKSKQVTPAGLKKAGLSLKEGEESFFAEAKTEATS